MEGYRLLKEWTGETDFAYPGHPLIIAAMVMSLYPSMTEAGRPCEQGWAEALGDSRIPGAGCHVGAGITALRRASEGQTCDQVVEWANRYWSEGKAGGHVANVPAGLEQAKMVEPHFRRLFASWDFRRDHTH